MLANHLGRLTAMDAATIKGVIDRLTGRGFTTVRSDPRDGRRVLVALTPAGSDLYDRAAPIAALISEKTLEPLGKHERSMFVALLRRLRLKAQGLPHSAPTVGAFSAGGVLRLRCERTMPSMTVMPTPGRSPSCTLSRSVLPAEC